MKQFLFFTISFLFQFYHAQSQVSLPPVYEIKSDTAEFQPLNDSCWQFLGIKNETWTIDQVSVPPVTDKFHFKNDNLQGSDTSFYRYWFRFRLKNKMNREARLALPTGADYADFYISGQSSDKWKHYVTGNMLGWDKKDGLKFATSIPVSLQPEEEITVYYFAKNSAPRIVNSFRYSISSYDKIIDNYVSDINDKKQYYNGEELTESFMIGFLLVAFFYTLAFFAIVRERVYLYFSLCVFFLCVLRANNTLGSYFYYESPSLTKYAVYLNYSWAFIHFFLIQFVRYFFKVFINKKVWDKFLLALGLFNILINLLLFFSNLYFPKPPDIIHWAYIFLWRFIPTILLITLFMYARKADWLSKLVIFAAFPMLSLYGVLSWFIAENEDPEKSIFPALAKWLAQYVRTIEALSILLLVLSFSMILFIRYNKLRKENAQQLLDNERLAKEKEIERNELIAKQKIQLEKDVAERTSELKQSLEELKSTQAQLIQSEKMASLGELTAGIAHEIQNPLNFVNNFSDVNKELLEELKEEADKGNLEDVKAIATDVISNEEKINHHGKRAEAIVKGMLQHSRTSSGQKELTDINALADEYLRLSYHGLRSKDKTFSADFKTEFDENIGSVNIIPQDIGRVLLNLYNNAFYTVGEKKKQQIEGYEPTVSVSTKKANGKIEVSVKDNGNGIPQKIVDKIFQPFFTTKPTGQGTGLGLSLSYDILKAHGGEIKVETKEGEGTDFVIQLPVKTNA
ncbi:MAG TPA: ATP-binding protein [Panacibacter sp.]|nr:ATP-binding protein [Panacibacter sp.]